MNPDRFGKCRHIIKTVGSYITLLQIDILHCQEKKNWNTKEDKDKSTIRALYALWLAKRHILGQSDIDQ